MLESSYRAPRILYNRRESGLPLPPEPMRALEDVEVSLVGVLNPTEDVDADHVSAEAERVGVAGDVILLVRRDGKEGGLRYLIMLCLPYHYKKNQSIASIKYSNISVEYYTSIFELSVGQNV